MAATNKLQTLKINGKSFGITPCWEQLGMTHPYMLALLSRDEYTPVATQQPKSTDTLYTDPVSGNPAGFHAGQCVVYPDPEVPDGWGLSIAKYVVSNSQGVPTEIAWHHITDMEKLLNKLKNRLESCIGTGVWENGYPWVN